MDDLAALITRVLDERDWTLTTLSRRSGIPVSTLHSWKAGLRAAGSRGPSPARLRLLADAVGIPVVTVFEAAGRHVPAPMDDAHERDFLNLLRSLTEEDKRVIRATMHAMGDRKKS